MTFQMTPRLFYSLFLLLPLLSTNINAQMDLQTVCDLASGTIQGGQCIVCISADTCCPVDLTTFAVHCDEFCTTGVYQNLPQTACGTAACVNQGITSACSASIPYTPEFWLNLTFTCGASGCECQEATWDEQVCDSCVGPGGGYDCSNVNGPVKVAVLDNTTAAVSPTADLTRWYLTDEEFLAEVATMTMPEASAIAGVPIGAAIADGLPLLETYIPSQYTMIVGENNMKWKNLLTDGNTLGDYNFTEADTMVDYAVSVDALVRGHALIWGRYKGSTYPEAVATQVEASNDPNATLLQLMRDHIFTTCQHFDGKVAIWDVVNEHLDSLDPEQNIFYKQIGHDYVKTSFELTKEALPEGVSLVWNEALADFDPNNRNIQLLLQMLQQYKDDGVPVDTLGVQGHSIAQKYNLTQAKTFFQTVAAMGYGIELTEVDAPITIFMNDERSDEDPFQAQADYLADLANLCLELPNKACKGVTFWGVDDAHTWYDWIFEGTSPNLPLLLDETGNPKPNWLSLRQALQAKASIEEDDTEQAGGSTGTATEGASTNQAVGTIEETASNETPMVEDTATTEATSAPEEPTVPQEVEGEIESSAWMAGGILWRTVLGSAAAGMVCFGF